MNKRIRKKLSKRGGMLHYKKALEADIEYFDRCLAECMWLGMEMGRRNPGPYTLATTRPPLVDSNMVPSVATKEEIRIDITAAIARMRGDADDV